MLSQVFLGLSLVGAEWVLYLLLVLSILSVAIIFERAFFYRNAKRGGARFQGIFRDLVIKEKWDEAFKSAEPRSDIASRVAYSLFSGNGDPIKSRSMASLECLAQDSIIQNRILWEKNLSVLATIGSNAPFIGLFGTVLGIIRAFHDLSQQASSGAQMVTAGIAEALIATAIGILVAIPATVAYNLFQKKVKTACLEAEALKNFLSSQLAK